MSLSSLSVECTPLLVNLLRLIRNGRSLNYEDHERGPVLFRFGGLEMSDTGPFTSAQLVWENAAWEFTHNLEKTSTSCNSYKGSNTLANYDSGNVCNIYSAHNYQGKFSRNTSLTNSSFAGPLHLGVYIDNLLVELWTVEDYREHHTENSLPRSLHEIEELNSVAHIIYYYLRMQSVYSEIVHRCTRSVMEQNIHMHNNINNNNNNNNNDNDNYNNAENKNKREDTIHYHDLNYERKTSHYNESAHLDKCNEVSAISREGAETQETHSIMELSHNNDNAKFTPIRQIINVTSPLLDDATLQFHNCKINNTLTEDNTSPCNTGIYLRVYCNNAEHFTLVKSEYHHSEMWAIEDLVRVTVVRDVLWQRHIDENNFCNATDKSIHTEQAETKSVNLNDMKEMHHTPVECVTLPLHHNRHTLSLQETSEESTKFELERLSPENNNNSSSITDIPPLTLPSPTVSYKAATQEIKEHNQEENINEISALELIPTIDIANGGSEETNSHLLHNADFTCNIESIPMSTTSEATSLPTPHLVPSSLQLLTSKLLCDNNSTLSVFAQENDDANELHDLRLSSPNIPRIFSPIQLETKTNWSNTIGDKEAISNNETNDNVSINNVNININNSNNKKNNKNVHTDRESQEKIVEHKIENNKRTVEKVQELLLWSNEEVVECMGHLFPSHTPTQKLENLITNASMKTCKKQMSLCTLIPTSLDDLNCYNSFSEESLTTTAYDAINKCDQANQHSTQTSIIEKTYNTSSAKTINRFQMSANENDQVASNVLLDLLALCSNVHLRDCDKRKVADLLEYKLPAFTDLIC